MTHKLKKPTLRVQFGRNVKQLRLSKQLTQEQLAEQAGISVDFLSLIERGLNSPSFENIERLADALAVPVSALFSVKGA